MSLDASSAYIKATTQNEWLYITCNLNLCIISITPLLTYVRNISG